MSRLIDADAFKEYMRKTLEKTRDIFLDHGELAEAVTKAFCKDIDEQPTVKFEQQWILCSERLPEDDREVLVTTKWDDVTCACRYETTDKWFINATTDDILAWMPLPEPYKGEQNGKD